MTFSFEGGEFVDEFGDALINPATGSITDMSSIDSLIASYVETRKLIAELKSFEAALRDAMWQRTEGPNKTRRIEGERYKAKVTEGAKGVSQPILKEAWNAFPEIADRFMRISSLSLQMREVKKLQGTTTDEPSLRLVKQMIEDAIEKGYQGQPTVAVEFGPDDE